MAAPRVSLDHLPFRAAADAAGDAVVLIERAARGDAPRVVYVNPAFTALTGYPASEFVGRSPWTLVDRRTDPVILRQLRRAFAVGDQCRAETLATHRDGSELMVEWSVAPIPDEGDQTRYSVAILRNVTEQRDRQILTRECVALLQATIDALAPHIVVLDPDGTIVLVNAAWRQFAAANGAASAGAYLGQNYLGFCRSSDAAAVAGAIEGVISGDSDSYYLEYPCHSPTEQRWFAMRVRPFDEAAPRRVTISHESITARRNAEAATAIAEDWLQLACDEAGVGLWAWDAAPDRVSASPSWLRALGYAPGNAPANFVDFLGLVHPDDLPLLYKSRAGVPDLATESEVELRLRCGDGEYRWFLGRAHIQRDEHGQPIRLIGAHIDIHERKRAQLAANQARSWLDLACHGAGIGLWQFDLATGITRLGESWRRLFGDDRCEVVLGDLPLLELIHPDDQAGYFEFIRHAFQGGPPLEPMEQEIRIRRPDGNYRWVLTRTLVVRDAEGKPVQVLGADVDIDRRRRAEADLRQSGERLSMALSAARGGVWATDLATDELFWSDEHYRLLGYDPTRDHASLRNWKARIHPDDRPKADAVIDAVRAGSVEEFAIEFRVVEDDGTVRWLRDIGGTDPNDSSRRRWGGVTMDVTARKLAELELARLTGNLEAEVERRSQELRRRALAMDAAVEGMAVLRDEVYLYMNPAHARMYGYPDASAVLGKTWRELYDADEQRRIESEIVPVLMHEGAWLGSLRGRRPDGTSVPVEVGLTLTADGNLVCVCRDITERSRIEAELRHSRDQLAATNADLERANRATDDFLANMSHELRTPLTAVLGITEALAAEVYGPLAPAQRDVLNVIDRSGRHLLELISDLLEWSRLHAGQPIAESMLVDLPTLSVGVLQMVRPLADAKHIELCIAGVLLVEGFASDERRIRQILVNLLGNAIKFTPERGHVQLTIRPVEAEGRIEFEVTDTGIGIAPEDLERIFEPFVQVDSGLARRQPGTGLGLALSRRLAEALGGDLTVTSDLGEGSRFTLRVPWGASDLPPRRAGTIQIAPPSAPRLEPARGSHRAHILVVEDNDANLQFISDFLESRGFAVAAAHDGLEAIEAVERAAPALIVMDVQMPRLNGLEATRRLRAAGVTVPIILLTALAMPGDRERCLEAGATDYLSKPIRLNNLADGIAAHLRRDKGAPAR